jgi:hypothetical protein
VSDETVRRHLHARRYAVIRPVLSISSPDEHYDEKVATRRAHQAAAKRGEVVLLYEDESDLHPRLLVGIGEPHRFRDDANMREASVCEGRRESVRRVEHRRYATAGVGWQLWRRQIVGL